jgi:hypothetical protein
VALCSFFILITLIFPTAFFTKLIAFFSDLHVPFYSLCILCIYTSCKK